MHVTSDGPTFLVPGSLNCYRGSITASNNRELLFVMELHSPHIWALKVKQGPLDLSGCSLLLLVVMEHHSPHICALKVKQGPLDLIVCSLLLLVVMEPM
jgi:hypothetical protein